VTFSVKLLEERGVTLPFPHSSAIEGTKPAMRELPVQSKGEPLRVLYIFDPKRQAVLLVGGNKTGDDRFYEREVPHAEKVYQQYLEAEAKRDAEKAKVEREKESKGKTKRKKKEK
jgi:hypothetical protein